MVEGMDRFVNVLKVSTVNGANLVCTTLSVPLFGDGGRGPCSLLISHSGPLFPNNFPGLLGPFWLISILHFSVLHTLFFKFLFWIPLPHPGTSMELQPSTSPGQSNLKMSYLYWSDALVPQGKANVGKGHWWQWYTFLGYIIVNKFFSILAPSCGRTVACPVKQWHDK